MPISDTDGYKKGHWQEVYNHLIKPAVEQAGYIPERADEIRSANLETFHNSCGNEFLLQQMISVENLL